MQCQSCGNSLPKGARTCPSCGEEAVVTVPLPQGAVKTGLLDYALHPAEDSLEPVPATVSFKCRKCDSDLKGGARFCSICGASVDPTMLSKALNAGKAGLQSSAEYIGRLPSWLAGPMILQLIAGMFLLLAIIQSFINLSIDSESNAAIIYHLRTIEFLLVALITEVASLIFRSSR